jgi:hypothetical protein
LVLVMGRDKYGLFKLELSHFENYV